jgi:hypothetical protein
MVVPKPYFLVLLVFAYSEFVAIMQLVGLGRKLRIFMSVLYILFSGLVFRSMA